jgi:hypothetical protein
MHTATQLNRSMFRIMLDGADASVEQLLPDWGIHDRLGVIVHEPFGIIGVSHLIQLGIVAFYDARPSRRDGRPRYGDSLAIYPEVYVFHVGGFYGDHSWLDVFPPRKDVVLGSDASSVLESINDRGITRLAVPDVTPAPAGHAWKEPASALDRITSAFCYTPSGTTSGADVEVAGLVPVTEVNVSKILDPAGPNGDDSDTPDRFSRARAELAQRNLDARSLSEDARAARDAMARQRAERRVHGVATESYRRIDVHVALEMLVPSDVRTQDRRPAALAQPHG